MALSAEDLIYPTGRIHPDLLPGRSSSELESDIEAWLTEAYADPRVTALDDDDLEDRAARAWAYHRAFDAACVQMATNPSSASESDAGSASYSKDQRDTVCRKAAEFLAEFNELAPKVTTDRRTGGMTVEHEFTW